MVSKIFGESKYAFGIQRQSNISEHAFQLDLYTSRTDETEDIDGLVNELRVALETIGLMQLGDENDRNDTEAMLFNTAIRFEGLD